MGAPALRHARQPRAAAAPIALLIAVIASLTWLLSGQAGAAAPAPAPGCVSQTQTFHGKTGAINPAISGSPATPVATEFQVPVSGMGASLYHVALTTDIQAAHSGDLFIALQPPGETAAATVRANSVNAKDEVVGPAEGENVFNGTLWEDSAAEPAAKTTFTNNVTAGPLEPDTAFARLDGVNPNGVWSLEVTSFQPAGSGTLTGWSLELATCQSTPAASPSSQSSAATVPVPHPGSAHSSISVAGLACYLTAASVRTEVLDNSAQALTMTLASPTGEVVALTSDNGAKGAADVFSGTLWEDGAPERVTSAALAGGKASSPLEPEQGLSRLIGENPNGTWTLTVTDGAEDTAVLDGWSLKLSSAGNLCPSTETGPFPSQPAPASPAAETVQQGQPTIDNLKLTPDRFHVQAKRGPHHARSGGTRISLTLSAAAEVRLSFQALTAGVRSGSRCVPTAAHRHGRPCTLTHGLGASITLGAHAGANTLAFAGKLAGHALAPGRYLLTATILTSAPSKPAQTGFAVLA